MKKLLPVFLLATIAFICDAQTLYVPSGTGGIGSSDNSNVGIGTPSNPQSKLDVNGNIQISNASLPMGLMTEVGGTTPLLNWSMNFREPNVNSSFIGGGFRIDSRGGAFPLFSWLYRPAGSAAGTDEKLIMGLTKEGNLGIG